jgi:hypothetical protein
MLLGSILCASPCYINAAAAGWIAPQTMAQRDARGSVGEGAGIQVRLLSPVELQQDPSSVRMLETLFLVPVVPYRMR